MSRPGADRAQHEYVKRVEPVDRVERAAQFEEFKEPFAAGPGRDPARSGAWRLNTDPEAVQRDLSRLVLTLVELVRQLVERQCIRRMDQGDLSDEQVETLGLTLMRLEEAMTELCDRFGLTPADLNLDLGPLGTLLPTD
jgi:hypothetical protein